MSLVARRYYLRGRDALERNEPEMAIESLSAAVDLVPTFVVARLAYSQALARIGDCPRAAQTLRAGLGRTTTVPGRAEMWAALGDVLVQSGDFLGAEDAFNQVAQFDGFAGRAAAGRARVFAKLGRYAESFSELATVASLSRSLDSDS